MLTCVYRGLIHEDRFQSLFFKNIKVGDLVHGWFTEPMLGFSFCYQVASIPNLNPEALKRELDVLNHHHEDNISYLGNIRSLREIMLSSNTINDPSESFIVKKMFRFSMLATLYHYPMYMSTQSIPTRMTPRKYRSKL